MTVNPNGYVNLTDGGTPRILTGYAKEIISGGQFVGGSGAAGVVGSGADSFVTTDIEFFHTTGSDNFIGVALHDVASGAPLSAATKGTFLVPVSGGTNVLAGTKVGCNNDSEVVFCGSRILGYGAATDSIGRALTTGSHGDYIVLDLRD